MAPASNERIKIERCINYSETVKSQLLENVRFLFFFFSFVQTFVDSLNQKLFPLDLLQSGFYLQFFGTPDFFEPSSVSLRGSKNHYSTFLVFLGL